MTTTAVIIVTHNSQDVLPSCLDSLKVQSIRPDRICIVDSGSRDTKYLDDAESDMASLVVQKRENLGFSSANNSGWSAVHNDMDYVLFMNPDALLDGQFIKQATEYMDQNPRVGLVTGLLLGYDFSDNQPTGRIDSTGIFRKWYGRWFDRGLGEEDSDKYQRAEDIPAACGALMYCRKSALQDTALQKDTVFDPQFFLYKEDIELCLRLRKSGWRIRYQPEIRAYHGRGWQDDRRKISFELRKMAARNEILLYLKHPSPYILWSLIKYFLVVSLNI